MPNRNRESAEYRLSTAVLLHAIHRGPVAGGRLPARLGGECRCGWSTENAQGIVEGDGSAHAGYDVSLYAAFSGGSFKEFVGSGTTDRGGQFKIEYRLLPGGQTKLVLYVLAKKGRAMLASAVRDLSKDDHVVVNELENPRSVEYAVTG